MSSKKVIIPALVLGGLMLWGTQASATNQSVVDKLVERFDLNEDEVTGVFDEAHQERPASTRLVRQDEAGRQQMEEKLDEAVEDGVITADQEQALLDKQAEMREKREQLREEMQQWRDESGIDFEALAPYHAGCGGRGFGKMHGFGGW